MLFSPPDLIPATHRIEADLRPHLTLADAILDRLVHNAHRLELKGASMRKRMDAKAEAETP